VKDGVSIGDWHVTPNVRCVMLPRLPLQRVTQLLWSYRVLLDFPSLAPIGDGALSRLEPEFVLGSSSEGCHFPLKDVSLTGGRILACTPLSLSRSFWF
jgi:hypothetical protein